MLSVALNKSEIGEGVRKIKLTLNRPLKGELTLKTWFNKCEIAIGEHEPC